MNIKTKLEMLGRIIFRHARLIMTGSGVLLLASLLAIRGLGVETDIAKLLPPDNPVAQSFTEITDEFDTTSSLIVLVKAENREQLVWGAEKLTERIQNDGRIGSLVRSIQLKKDLDFMESRGLLLQDNEELSDVDRTFSSLRLLPLLQETNDLMEEKLATGMDDDFDDPQGEDEVFAMMSRFSLFSRYLGKAFTEDHNYTDKAAAALLFGDEYFIDPEEQHLLLFVKPNFDLGDRANLQALSDGVHRIAAELEETAPYPALTFHFTGDVENEADEERAISSDIFYPTLIAIVLIIILFLLSFRKKRAILFSIFALISGLVLVLAFAALTVKDLNMITSSFGALLVGLGIDFGIHIVSRYDDALGSGKKGEDAMGEVFSSVALPILIGGLTTAIAFYSLIFSKTMAFRQFGLIAGTGILCTLLSAFTIIPALLALFPGKKNAVIRKPLLDLELPSRLVLAAGKTRIPVITVAGILILMAAFTLGHNSFEYDLRKIGPQETEAKETERLVGDRFGISTWLHMIKTGSVEEAREMTEQFRDASMVRRVESMADYLPSEEDQRERLRRIADFTPARIRNSVREGFVWNEESLDDLLYEIQRLEWNMIELGDLAAASLGENSMPVRKRNSMIHEVFGSERGKEGDEVFQNLIQAIEHTEKTDMQKLAVIENRLAAALEARLANMLSVHTPLALGDIPSDIRDELVNADGTGYLVQIHGTKDMAGDENFIRFSDELLQINETVTGTLTLGVMLSREILSEAGRTAVIVLIVVMLLVALSFRSIRLTILAFISLGTAIIWMFGLSPFVGKFNIVNILSLPLIIGIGIDYCVHVITALNDKDHAAENIRSTAKAITLSALTTGIGFGSLALAGKFQGIADLGKTLFIGIMCCYICALIILPALLAPKNTGGKKKELS